MKKLKPGKTPAPKKAERAPELGAFEDFLKTIGFKRSDGTIYGLLVLSPVGLSSEEIGKQLGLSQGAVSQGLKKLTHWGAVESRYTPERRVQLHTATVDSLKIVATVFQKREQGAIDAFRRANAAARDRFLAEGADPESDRLLRLESNVTTCEFAQVVMEFVVGLSRLGVMQAHYARVVRSLPRALGLLMKGPKLAGGLKTQVVARWKERSLWG